MKEILMHLKTIPDGWYTKKDETVVCLSPGKVYMVRQIINGDKPLLQYFFRLPTSKKVYEALITETLYEGILTDIDFSTDDIKYQRVAEYLFGKDTIRVICDYNFCSGEQRIVAVGPEENKEWQYEFQKYHI